MYCNLVINNSTKHLETKSCIEAIKCVHYKPNLANIKR